MQRPPCAGWACSDGPPAACHVAARRTQAVALVLQLVGQSGTARWQQRASVGHGRQQQRQQIGGMEPSRCTCHVHACVKWRPDASRPAQLAWGQFVRGHAACCTLPPE